MKLARTRAFTLIELTIVIAIIATLVVMMMPEADKFIARSRSVTCMNNLRQVGVGILSYVADNDNTYPVIEPNPESPVYDPQIEATPLTELESYGITDMVLKCPSDKKYFADRGSSYQWRVILDDENAAAPKIYGGRRGGVRVVKPSRVTICTDYEAVHFGRLNRLYADGHVVAKLSSE